MKKALLFILAIFIVFNACKKKESDQTAPLPAAPAADFAFIVDTTKYPALVVNFTNHSVNAKTYSWNFGDGKTSTDSSPAHTFSSAGTYSVSLTAVGDGGSNVSQKNVTIGQPVLVGATFTAAADVTVAEVNLSTDSTVYDHYAFPDIAKLSDGRFIVDWRAGTQHDQLGHGKIMKSFGSADGLTWTAPQLLYDDTTKDDRDFSINRLSNGILLGDFFKWGTGKCSVTKSMNDGQTFSDPVDINILPGSANPSSQAEEINDTLWLPTYGTDGSTNSRIYMFKSADFGNTWTEQIIASTLLGGLNLQEPCIIKGNNNRLIIHVRTADNVTPPYGLRNMYQYISDDNGKTWAFKDLGFIGQSPALYRTESGILISAFRWINAAATQTYVGMIYSTDNGNTWSDIITVAGYNDECGYPAIESMGNDKFFLVYYWTIPNGGGTTKMQINTKIYQFNPIFKVK